jgi:hypothetical protein
MKCYVIGDETVEGWGLRELRLAFALAGAQALFGDVVIEKRDGDEVVATIPVGQVAPKPIREGRVEVPKEYRKNFGA